MKVFPDFEKRANKDSGNILLSYGVGEDEEADKRGFAFLGVCKDGIEEMRCMYFRCSHYHQSHNNHTRKS